MWVRTFVQTEKDYEASQQQYGARTHAGGGLGGELKDKPKKKNNKKRQAGYGGGWTRARTRTRASAARVSSGRMAHEKKSEAGAPASHPGQLPLSVNCVRRPQAEPRGLRTGRTAPHCSALARNPNSRQIMFVWGVCAIRAIAQYIHAPTGS